MDKLNLVLNSDTNPTKVIYPISDSSISVISTQLLQESNNFFQVNAVCDSNLGIAENTWKTGLIIFPNPVIKKITIQSLDQNNPIVEVLCYDLLGKQVLQQKQTANEIILHLEDLSGGFYILRTITRDKNIRIHKIFKRVSIFELFF